MRRGGQSPAFSSLPGTEDREQEHCWKRRPHEQRPGSEVAVRGGEPPAKGVCQRGRIKTEKVVVPDKDCASRADPAATDPQIKQEVTGGDHVPHPHPRHWLGRSSILCSVFTPPPSVPTFIPVDYVSIP